MTNARLSLRCAGAAFVSMIMFGTAATLADPVTAQDDGIALERAPSGHLLMPVTIAGQGPFTFILDTGATHTAISAFVARQLGFESEWEDIDDVQALTTRFEAERFALEALQFGTEPPARIHSVIIPVSDGQPGPVAGLLGVDAIRGDRYQMNFASARLLIDPAPPERSDGLIDPSGLLVGEASLLRVRRPVHVMLDSGSARTIANIPLRRLTGNGHMMLRTIEVGGIDGRDVEDADQLSLRQFRIGGLCFPALRVLQSDLDIFRHLGWRDEPAIVIGMDLLQYAEVTVDRESGSFQIEAAGPEFACND